jgi:hypothetical protein
MLVDREEVRCPMEITVMALRRIGFTHAWRVGIYRYKCTCI